MQTRWHMKEWADGDGVGGERKHAHESRKSFHCTTFHSLFPHFVTKRDLPVVLISWLCHCEELIIILKKLFHPCTPEEQHSPHLPSTSSCLLLLWSKSRKFFTTSIEDCVRSNQQILLHQRIILSAQIARRWLQQTFLLIEFDIFLIAIWNSKWDQDCRGFLPLNSTVIAFGEAANKFKLRSHPLRHWGLSFFFLSTTHPSPRFAKQPKQEETQQRRD